MLAARSATATAAEPCVFPAGATSSATMAACCSSTCATITASPNASPTRIRRPLRKSRSSARSGWCGSTARSAIVPRAPSTPNCRPGKSRVMSTRSRRWIRRQSSRADCLPGEFHQFDLEMSFVDENDVFAASEPVITGVLEEFAKGKPVTKVWPRIPFAEALKKYGSEKPDLRNPLITQDVSEHFRGSGFKVFARMLEDPKNQVWAIPGPAGGSRAFCDRMNSWAQGEGQPGLGYIMWREGGEGAGPLANNIGVERTAAIRTQLGLKEGDAAFFVAGDPDKFWQVSGLARTRLGDEVNLIDKEP